VSSASAADQGLSLSRSIAVAALLVLAVGLFAASPFHGPILFVVSPGHGFDLGDMAALAAIVAAACLARPLLASVRGPLGILTRSRPALAGLGAALAVTGLLDRAGVAEDLGAAYDVVAALALVAIVAWTIAAAVVDPVPWPTTLPATVAALGAALGAGLLLDASLTPSGTLFCTIAVALVLAVRSVRVAGRILFVAETIGMLAINVASLGDIAGIDVPMSRSGGGAARSVALAAVLLTATVYDAVGRRRAAPTRARP
jgi:hypothetical protein